MLSPGEIVYEGLVCSTEKEAIWYITTTCQWEKSFTGEVGNVIEGGADKAVERVINPIIISVALMLFSMLAFFVYMKTSGDSRFAAAAAAVAAAADESPKTYWASSFVSLGLMILAYVLV